jgi:hypothetical protein
LSSLVPRTDRLDRDRLMFLAGQQSGVVGRVGQAQRRPTDLSETADGGMPDGGSALRLTHPTRTRWAWPAAFAAMTAVAAALAILLAIQPALPNAGSNPKSPVASANDRKPPRDVQAHANPVAPDWDPGSDERVQPPSRWLAFLQSFWKAGDAGNATEVASPASESLASSYPRLRNDMLRRGIESWQVARNFHGAFSASAPESSANRELLKQYLPESN